MSVPRNLSPVAWRNTLDILVDYCRNYAEAQ